MQVMSSTEKMAELSIPFILSKIKETPETSVLIKREALSFLRHFSARYPGCILEQYAA